MTYCGHQPKPRRALRDYLSTMVKSFVAVIALAVLTCVSLANSTHAQAALLASGAMQTSEVSTSGTGAESGTGSGAVGADLAAALREAAQAGLTVVVVDGQGGVVTASGHGGADGAGGPDANNPMNSMSTLMQVQSRYDAFRATLITRLEALPNSINEVAYILRATSPNGEISLYLRVLAYTLVLLLIAHFVTNEVYAKRYLNRVVLGRILDAPVGYRQRMPFLVFRFFLGLSVTVISVLVAYILDQIFLGDIEDVSVQFTVTAIVTAYLASRIVADFWRMLLSPNLPQYRIPQFSDRDAKRLFKWAVVIAVYCVWSMMFATWIKDFGLNYNVYAALFGVLELLGTLLNVSMVVTNATSISNAIRGGKSVEDVSWSIRTLSVLWAPVLVLLFVSGWFALVFDLVLERPGGMPIIAGLFLAFMAVVTVYGLISFAIEQYFEKARRLQALRDAFAAESQSANDGSAVLPQDGPNQGPNQGHDQGDPKPLNSADNMKHASSQNIDDGDHAETDDDDEGEGGTARADLDGISLSPIPTYTILTFEQLSQRVAGIIAFCVGLYAMVEIWDPIILQGRTTLTSTLLDVVVVLFIGYVIYNIFRIWIDSKIAEETEDMPELELGDEGGGAASASRLATLLPLFRGAILALVVVTIGLIALMELGINVSPLFAGAGVVGLAVGFGAQTLVRDIFSGAFFLIDDAFRKGEYIDVGDVKGTVEKISVRSMQLRHHLGALNTIPFGEIKVLTNFSRDWVMMKLPLRVTYDTDVERVRKLIKKLGQELLTDPEIGENFIQPLKSQGVIEMQDSAMIIRVKFMTKPGDQWIIRKKVYHEIRELFAREGIKFAHREVTVRLADGKDPDNLTTAEKQAVTGAVEAALEADMALGKKSLADDR
jgi:small-conductance mechanosensitive channel